VLFIMQWLALVKQWLRCRAVVLYNNTKCSVAVP
jgi:hypothetical protein